jgi:O-acetyl-ADP-ribose deacetylase (regulator of RNase III)
MIEYTIGDAVYPKGEGQKLITHICNDQGGWGRGFVVALSRRDKIAENAYRLWHRNGYTGATPFELGQTQIVNFADDIWVANMIAQAGIRHDPSAPPAVRYDALRSCLTYVARYTKRGLTPTSVHMPRIGCGLGDGSWDKVEAIINDTLISEGIKVTVYDLKED